MPRKAVAPLATVSPDDQLQLVAKVSICIPQLGLNYGETMMCQWIFQFLNKNQVIPQISPPFWWLTPAGILGRLEGVKMTDHLQRLVVLGRLNAGFCPFTGHKQTTLGGAEVGPCLGTCWVGKNMSETLTCLFCWWKKHVFQNIVHNWSSGIDLFAQNHVNAELPKRSKRDSSIVDEIEIHRKLFRTGRCLASFFKMHNMFVFLSWSSIVPTSSQITGQGEYGAWPIGAQVHQGAKVMLNFTKPHFTRFLSDTVIHVYNIYNIVV